MQTVPIYGGKYLKDFVPCSYSSYITFLNGEIVDSKASSVCYSGFTSMKVSLDEVLLFFNKSRWKDNKATHDFCDWICNRSPFANAFLTKCSKEGRKYGFRLDTSQPRYMVTGGAQALKSLFEFGLSWGFFMDKGYSELDSYILSLHFSVEGSGEGMSFSSVNCNHLPIKRDEKYKVYQGKMAGVYKSDLATETLKKGYSKGYWDGSSEYWAGKKPPANKFSESGGFKTLNLKTKLLNDDFGQPQTVFKTTKENCKVLLKYLKGKV